jgi:hypothetical protein
MGFDAVDKNPIEVVLMVVDERTGCPHLLSRNQWIEDIPEANARDTAAHQNHWPFSG